MKLNKIYFLLALLLAGAGFAETAQEEASIARMTATLLDQSHFAAHRHDQDLSGRFLDHYLDILDPTHSVLLESDVQDFAPYRATLGELTLQGGDISPAQKIFTRFLYRLEQRVAYAKELLAKEQFKFEGHDTYLFDREKAPRPRDMADAERLWKQQLRFEYLQEKLNKTKPAEIVTTLTKRYERTYRTMKNLSSDQVFESYLNALARVYDPHSDYLGRRQLEEFGIAMKLSLCGIGAVLRFDDGYCKIHELMPGGPAATSKLIKPGDRIVGVAQGAGEMVDIIEMPLTDAVQLIRGAKGTQVRLTLIPADAADTSARRTITLQRDEIKIESQQAKARLVDLPREGPGKLRLGIIDLPSFYTGDGQLDDQGRSGATADVAKLIEKLKVEGIQGLILDLRLNGGGSLEEAIRLTGLFVERGPVVQTKDAAGNVKVSRDPDPSVLYDGPLTVLTSRASASASEILAGALQDYGRALIVGDSSTFGKGTVQSMIELAPLMRRNGLDGGDNPGALKLTFSKFYRPSGSSTQLKGVVPDLVLPSPLAALKLGESLMPESLPWDEIRATDYVQLNRVAPYLPALQKQSAARVARDQEFIWLREDIDRFKQQRERQTLSLNEKERLKETAEQKARLQLRKTVRAKRPLSAETQYEITLKNAATAGLPAPLAVTASNTTFTAANLLNDDGDAAAPTTDDKNPPPDATLEETKRILVDYIRLTARTDPVTAQTAPLLR